MIERVMRLVLKPFTNLNSLEMLVQWLRLISSVLIVIFNIIVVLGPLSSPRSLYMSKLDTFSADITQGLFDVLRTNMESSGSTNINNGVGLTTSELLILTEYTATQVKDAPQFITVSLYGRCDCTFTTDELVGLDGKSYVVRNSTITCGCINVGSDYLFDYREVLSNLGLGIILDYAYSKDGSKMGLSDAYSKYINSLKRRKISVTNLLYAVLASEILITALTLWYYSIKGRYLNVFLERTLVHVISLLSFTVFICGLASIISLAWLNYKVQSRIKSELQAFGFSYHLGGTWFACLWMLAIFVSISCFVWSGLEWCIAENYEPYFEESNGIFLETQPQKQRLTSDPFADDQTVDSAGRSISNSSAKRNTRFVEARQVRSSGSLNALSRLNSSRAIRNKSFNQSQNPFEENDYALDEQYELQSIALRSSTDSDLNEQQVLQPSSTMHF
ncbi:Ecm7p [Nakaseomyces bracarensis]|uniref:Ecm7p n=1 Tax=Nakaseomyces bracarensis TaxID=273131 RepID=UPI0038724887